ncbi:MAG: class I SAM-dependent methyltransferase [Vicinamibacterales bacterium]
MSLGIRRRLGHAKWRCQEAGRRFFYRLPLPGSRRFVEHLWEDQAEMIHSRWGDDRHDYAVIGRLLDRYRPQSVLDVGCGSGRLFGLYADRGIPTVLGVDISQRGLDIARRRFPNVPTIHSRLEELTLPGRSFDVVICNRVLQHVPPRAIRHVVERLCSMGRCVYVNELAASDEQPENYYMVRHEYRPLFEARGFAVLDEGRLGDQTYQVYTPDGELPVVTEVEEAEAPQGSPHQPQATHPS